MHSLHVVHVGLMGNLHYLEVLDWLGGWPGYDICRDDKATWLAEEEAAQKVATLSRAGSPQEPPPEPGARPQKKPARLYVGPLDAQP